MGKIIRNGIEYGGTYDSATSVNYDNSVSGLNARTVQEGIDELGNNLTASDNLKFRFATDGEGNYGYLGADDSFIPFSNLSLLDVIYEDTSSNNISNSSSATKTVKLSKGNYLILVFRTNVSNDGSNYFANLTSYTNITITDADELQYLGGYIWYVKLNTEKTITITSEKTGSSNTSKGSMPIYVYGLS